MKKETKKNIKTKRSKPETKDIAVLRKKAEKKLREQTDRLEELSEKDVRQLVHELGTHQIELEMQNEELRRAQSELEASRSKYSDLYDFSPIGYFTFDKTGLILELNLTGAILLGVSRSNLLNRPFSTFIAMDDRNVFHTHCSEVLKKNAPQTCEIRLRKKDGIIFYANLRSIPVKYSDGNAVCCRTAIIDITERKESEETLRKSNEKYRLLFHNMINGLAYHKTILDQKGKPVDYIFLEVNTAFERLTGLKKENIIGKGVREVLPGIENDPVDWIGIYGKVTLTGKEIHIEQYAEQLGKWYSVSAYSPMRDYFVTIFEDITERKQAEESLRQSQQTFAHLVENAPFGIYIVDSQFRISHMNVGSQAGAFQNVRPVIGRDFSETMRILWPEPVAAEIIGHFRHTLETGEPYYSPQFINPRHDIEIVESYEWELHRMTLPDGQFGVICYYFDSTQLRRAEEAFRQSREDLNRAQEVGGIGSWRLDVKRNVLTWSDENHRIFGIPKGTAMTYETFLSAVHPDDRAYVDTQWKAGLKGAPYDIEHRLLVEGRIKWVREKAYLEFDRDGSLLGGFGITQDITERKKAEEALHNAHDELAARSAELEIVNKELETFSYTVSHDLKAPLRSIQGFAKAVNEDYKDRLDDTGRNYLLRINSAGEKMTQLIEAMMELSRLTSRELMATPVNLSSIAEVIASELRKNEPGRKIEFVIAKGAKAHGDSALMEIVLRNLLDNALKFTSKHDSAKIEFGTLKVDGKNVYFVRDDGVGFDMRYSDKLFKSFQHLHAGSEFPGIGIGLAIAWKIIIKHGGRIWAESEPEKGTTFYFTLE